MAGVLNNRNNTYRHTNQQEEKGKSIISSKTLVSIIKEKILQIQNVASCEQYEPDESLRVNGAPAVRLPSGKLAIAPDLKCTLQNGKIFWVEVKDKCQRFYKPDTGADLHQILGFYQINNELNEPVLMVFKDARLNDCLVSNTNETLKQKFEQRWNLFKGEPYGNWISKCIKQNGQYRYPRIAQERSRDIKIYIFYFYIYNLQPINFDNILSTLTTSNEHINISAFEQNKDEMKFLNEKELLSLSY